MKQIRKFFKSTKEYCKVYVADLIAPRPPGLMSAEDIDRLYSRGVDTATAPDSCDGPSASDQLPLNSSGHKVLVIVADSFKQNRKNIFSKNICSWGKSRNIDVSIIPYQDLKNVDFSEVSFCYFPLRLAKYSDVAGFIPDNIPLVLDYDNSPIEEPITHRTAVRNAFGAPLNTWRTQPQQQIPMLQAPIRPLKKRLPKDVIVFDVKNFHELSTHFQVSSIISEMFYHVNIIEDLENKMGIPVKIYFTSFFDYSIYKDLFDIAMNKKWFMDRFRVRWEEIEKRIIPPAKDHDDFMEIMNRCRLLITEHGDIADADVIAALCLGIPTLTYRRVVFAQSKGFSSTVLDALLTMDPLMEKRLELANMTRIREEWGLSTALRAGAVPAWDIDCYEMTYFKSWDILHRWAVEGIVDKKMNEEMHRKRFSFGAGCAIHSEGARDFRIIVKEINSHIKTKTE